MYSLCKTSIILREQCIYNIPVSFFQMIFFFKIFLIFRSSVFCILMLLETRKSVNKHSVSLAISGSVFVWISHLTGEIDIIVFIHHGLKLVIMHLYEVFVELHLVF